MWKITETAGKKLAWFKTHDPPMHSVFVGVIKEIYSGGIAHCRVQDICGSTDPTDLAGMQGKVCREIEKFDLPGDCCVFWAEDSTGKNLPPNALGVVVYLLGDECIIEMTYIPR